MKAILICVGSLFICLCSTASAVEPEWSTVEHHNFELDAVGSLPAGFSFAKSESGKPGRWTVRSVDDAPSGRNVLVQSDADRSEDRFLMAVADRPKLRDVRVSVRCKPIAGNVDQACGIVFRYQSATDYYLARSNALEGNVRLYHVRSGQRRQLANWEGQIRTGVWQELAAEIVANRIRIFFDGEEVISKSDRTFYEAGAVGLWVKADSVSAFDELNIASPASNSEHRDSQTTP